MPGGKQEHQGAKGAVAEGVQHVADADGRAGPACEVVQDLGEPLSGLHIVVR
jgi:protein involved in temperature-dependent protein secretion